MIKTISIPLCNEQIKRKITQHARWCSLSVDESLASLSYISSLSSLSSISSISISKDNNNIAKLVHSQLSKKIANYKVQDIEKGLYEPALFVTMPSVVQLLMMCELKCHYCDKEMQVLYENVREPLQWSLDRIDNAHGHNTGNVVAACLACNLRRKTTHHDRFMRGTQLKWNKLE